ncbi:MAG: glycerol-3-phosphate 1-O-acyltransferase PlsY [Lachnospiraceae bacterium]|nr:glycerol-3-phosphate 1-O-acyltransferase PlsY [Lachnospiraceae bacterium]
MERIICLAAGYVFGLFQTGFIYGKMHGIDIRRHGSGNSGATNTLRVLGKKAGAIVFFGDALKALIPCTVLRIVLSGSAEYAGMAYLLMLYLGFGVILGHNFPFYMNFKGGKGIAATAGLVASMDWRLTLVCAVVFLGAVILTRFVSLGSILVAVAFFAVNLFLSWKGEYGLDAGLLPEFWVLLGAVSLMAIWRHKANIKRLLAGNENKLWGKKE